MTFNFRNIVTALAIGLFAIGTSQVANAQYNRRNDDRREDRREEKQREKAAKAAAKAERQRMLWERQRQAAWTQRNRQVQIIRSGNDRSGGLGYYTGNANDNTNRNYRVYRNGSYYNIDQRGADLLRQAVNQGYQQGFQAGRNDRSNVNRRNFNWSNSNVYRSGNMGYQSYVNQSQYRYYFQQGFQRGYQDGSNSRYTNDYDGQYEYGYYNNGSPSILESILNTVLRIQTY